MLKYINKLIISIIIISIMLLLIGTSVQAVIDESEEDSQAVKSITTITEQNDNLIGPVLKAEKLNKVGGLGYTVPLKYFTETLFFVVRDYDLKDITNKLKNEGRIPSTSELYSQLQEMCEGKQVIYLGFNVKKPENISKIELILKGENGPINLLDEKDFNHIELQEDGSYNCYLEYAFYHDGTWAQGVGIRYLNESLILNCYTNENDENPVSSSKVVLTPENITKEDFESEDYKEYILLENGNWTQKDSSEYEDYKVNVWGPQEILNKITYDEKTNVVTLNNMGTESRKAFIAVYGANINVKGTNIIDELYCYSDYTKIDLEAEARLKAFISRKAADGVVVEFGDEVEDSYEFPYIVTDAVHFQYQTTILTSTKLKFKDVTKGEWYYDAVKYCYDNNMIYGTSDDKFSPEQDLTRGMLVTILWRMDGAPELTSEMKFTDVSNKMYYYNAIKWASNNKIVSGYTNTTKFGPDDKITREQLAVMLRNYCKYKGNYKVSSINLNSYKDSNKISSWAKDAVQWAVENKVVTGDNNYLTPGEEATRAEIASMLFKYCSYIK